MIDEFLKEREISEPYYLPQFLFASFFTDIRIVLDILEPAHPFISTRKSYYRETVAAMAHLNLMLDGYKKHSEFKNIFGVQWCSF